MSNPFCQRETKKDTAKIAVSPHQSQFTLQLHGLGPGPSPHAGHFLRHEILLLLGSRLRLIDAGADALLVTLATDALLCLGMLLAHDLVPSS